MGMSEPKNEDPIKKKISEIDKKVDTTSFLMFSYIQAILALLHDKELTHEEEFSGYLEKSREQLAKMMQDAQFLETMKDFLPKDDKGKPE